MRQSGWWRASVSGAAQMCRWGENQISGEAVIHRLAAGDAVAPVTRQHEWCGPEGDSAGSAAADGPCRVKRGVVWPGTGWQLGWVGCCRRGGFERG